MIKSPANQEISYGLIELNPDAMILSANNEGKRLLNSDETESNNLFHQVKNNEIKTKLHECFMGKSSSFILTFDTQPYFFLFHRTFKDQKLDKIHVYMLNINYLQTSHDHNNWNNHLLSSIGEMAAGIAHEVRNPLTAVKGFLQLMEQTYNQEYSQIAQSELDRAIHILNDLMSVSKPEFAQEKQISFNVCAEIESILLLFQNQLYDINLIKRFDNECAMVVGRKDQIKKALFNLIKNAIEAMPKGGTLFIEQNEDLHEIHLNISDSGIGIPQDKIRLLGTPFFTLKQDGKGMGLAQVYNAIHGNHGKVRVTSEEGEGTTFYLSFSKTIQHSNQFIGGQSMIQVIDSKLELTEFLNKNLAFYTEEWVQYLHKNKSYITSLMRENGELDGYAEFGNPIMKLVAQNILEVKIEEIMDVAKERGVKSAKTEFPIHLAWELFQSTRGIIWNAIKAFYIESQSTLDTEEFFTLERNVNDIIDIYIDSYTAYFVNYKEELLKSHRETVDELSVPIIPIAERVCILPVVGNVDTYRAKKIREKTLIRVKELKAQKLIIDISGVPFVDTAVVNHLFKIVKGIKLLGCSTILTGISPEIADTMIELGIEIDDDVKTRSDLQQALQDISEFRIGKQ
ncbi:ATP-binding protein [Bacillus sp. 1NLA3E]|uniref:ATP-binding protein n=1 Tax=Bacillus sp. 1NLA3E TaxID=666686 RepID=UPI000247ECA5|nr:ATP-binding protein [Bacillus sp. 1NLA3E]AGK52330.1 sporulation-specific ATP-dependent protein histidine kinase [Bacillus sp. 1NLA3E]